MKIIHIVLFLFLFISSSALAKVTESTSSWDPNRIKIQAEIARAVPFNTNNDLMIRLTAIVRESDRIKDMLHPGGKMARYLRPTELTNKKVLATQLTEAATEIQSEIDEMKQGDKSRKLFTLRLKVFRENSHMVKNYVLNGLNPSEIENSLKALLNSGKIKVKDLKTGIGQITLEIPREIGVSATSYSEILSRIQDIQVRFYDQFSEKLTRRIKSPKVRNAILNQIQDPERKHVFYRNAERLVQGEGFTAEEAIRSDRVSPALKAVLTAVKPKIKAVSMFAAVGLGIVAMAGGADEAKAASAIWQPVVFTKEHAAATGPEIDFGSARTENFSVKAE